MTPLLGYANISLSALTGTITYTVLGIILMLLGITAANYIFRLDLRKELIQDQNVAFGVLIGGCAIGIGIIIAASFF
jgi:putative membrane protein